MAVYQAQHLLAHGLAIQPWQTTGTPTPDPVLKAKGIAFGFRARDFGTATAHADLVDAVVINVGWGDLCPTGPAITSAQITEITRQLDWCTTNGKKACMRPRLGYDAGLWVGDDPLVGRIQHWSNHSSTDKDGNATPGFLPGGPPSQPTSTWRQWKNGLPRYWTQRYFDLVVDYYTRLYNAFGGHPALVELDYSWMMTQFVEGCNQQLGLQENIRNLMDGGWTRQRMYDMFTLQWQWHMQSPWATARVAVATSYNPIGELQVVPVSTQFPTGYKFKPGNTTDTIALMEKHRTIAGALSMIFNKSWVTPYAKYSAGEADMYDRMIQMSNSGTMIGWQTETLDKINAKYKTSAGEANVQDTLIAAVQYGGVCVEIPGGCWDPAKTTDLGYPKSLITPSFKNTWSGLMATNNAGKWAA